MCPPVFLLQVPLTLALRPKGDPRASEGASASFGLLRSASQAAGPGLLSWYIRALDHRSFVTWEERLQAACQLGPGDNPATPEVSDSDCSVETDDGALAYGDGEYEQLDEGSEAPSSGGGSGLNFLRSFVAFQSLRARPSPAESAARPRPANRPATLAGVRHWPSESELRAAV